MYILSTSTCDVILLNNCEKLRNTIKTNKFDNFLVVHTNKSNYKIIYYYYYYYYYYHYYYYYYYL